jgi:cytochrome P450
MMTATPKPEVNLVSPENLLNPNPLYHHLQESDPVHWAEPLQSWFVTRHDDVTACFRDARLSADRSRLFYEHQLRGVGLDKVKDQMAVAERQMLMKDGPAHTRLRRNANPGFSAQVMEGWRTDVRRTAEQLLESLQGRGHMDLAVEFAAQLPARVIMEFFAIPQQDRERFQQWTLDNVRIFAGTIGDVQEAAVAANTAIQQLSRYLEGFVRERRAKPGRDMLSVMVNAEEEGRLDEKEVIANAILITTAGHITTVDQISNGMHALLTHPEQLRRLKQEPGLLKSAVEEVLRYSPSVPFMHRIATEDFELRGRTIRKGQVVFLGMAAANRDASVFPEPDTFDISRPPGKHLSFAFGPHMCLGASLARLELETAFELLLQRLPQLRLDDEQPARIKCNSLVFRGFDSLPVRW